MLQSYNVGQVEQDLALHERIEVLENSYPISRSMLLAGVLGFTI